MVSKRNERLQVLQRFLKYNSANMKLFCFTPSEIDWEQKRINGIHRVHQKWVMSKFPFPQVIFNRCYTVNQELVKRIETVIGRNQCFNHTNRFNKYEAYLHLTEWLMPHLPETALFDGDNAIRLLNSHKVVYLKPCHGNKGIGVYRVELKDSGEIHIGHHHFSPEKVIGDISQLQAMLQKMTGTTPYIIQQGVNVRKVNDHVFDIRILVQKNMSGLWTATNMISRIACKGCFNTSIFEKVSLSQEVLKQFYSQEEADVLIGSIYDLSLRTAEIMELHAGYHLGEISVDLALDQNGHVWIIEINGMPQKALYSKIRNRGIVYERPMQYAHYLCKRSN
jgi:hypothetical protein